MPRHPPPGSAAVHKVCWWLSILSMYTVIAAPGKQGFFILVGVLSERCNLNTGREQSVLFRHTFFHSSPAAVITCVYAWAILGSAPHHALLSTPAFQPRAAEIREDAQSSDTLYWLPCSQHLLRTTEAALIVLRKFDKKPNIWTTFNSEKSFTHSDPAMWAMSHHCNASWAVKWIRRNNFLVPCIYLEVQKPCCLPCNVLFDIPSLEPYPTPLPPSNLLTPLVRSGEITLQHLQKQKGHQSGCMVDGKGIFSLCNSGSPTPVLFFGIAKDHFSPKHKGLLWAASLKDRNRSTYS